MPLRMTCHFISRLQEEERGSLLTGDDGVTRITHPRCWLPPQVLNRSDSGRLDPSVLGWEGIPASSWDRPLIYGPCHPPPLLSLISGFKISVTPASGGKRPTGKVLWGPEGDLAIVSETACGPRKLEGRARFQPKEVGLYGWQMRAESGRRPSVVC